ncbi:MFS transporter-like protein [Xylogone sp. PMI_703]|nr:MFS transporter-like protein [Xylogone sp. PMI_703]
MTSLVTYLPFATGTTTLQASTYLFGVCLFSISFLVFLNSSVSFVITDLIGVKDGVGDLVGTLGFVDELVALVACPFWGILSDRFGVRNVCAIGYAIVGISLILFVQADDVYPQLLLARVLFSIGGAATATMVTAILPSMTGNKTKTTIEDDPAETNSAVPEYLRDQLRRSISDSLNSEATEATEVTVTPSNYNGNPRDDSKPEINITGSSPPRLAGLVGLFTGCGALVALTLFLPLPAQFSQVKGITQGQAVADSFYVVGSISILVALFCYFGLGGLRGEENKGLGLLLGAPSINPGNQVSSPTSDNNEEDSLPKDEFLPYWRLLFDSTLLGFRDAQIGLGYLGGFVARASSVGISLFIPLYINAYFIQNGFCKGSPNDPSPELKKECRAAYILSAELTGISQLIALLCAPIYGYFSDRYRRFNVPLLVSSMFGIIGYIAFARLRSPEFKDVNGRGGGPAVFLIVASIGISQIGAIVCSLGLLGRGVLGEEGGYNLSSQLQAGQTVQGIAPSEPAETAPLIGTPLVTKDNNSRDHLKGSIAGVYSLTGGAAILLLTKLGGYLFDTLSPAAPFYMMAIFNTILLLGGIGAGIYREVSVRQHKY